MTAAIAKQFNISGTLGENTIDIEDVVPEDALPPQSMYSSNSWQMLNRREHGACLSRNRRLLPAPLFGEIVEIRAGEDYSVWAVALVRWLAVTN